MNNLLNIIIESIMKTFTTNVCIATSFIGAIASVLSLIYINDLAFIMLFMLTAMMIFVSLILMWFESDDDNNDIIFQDENHCDICVRDLAYEFSKIICEWHTDHQLVSVLEENRANKLVGNRCCASQNYYDANEAMAEAFKNLFGS